MDQRERRRKALEARRREEKRRRRKQRRLLIFTFALLAAILIGAAAGVIWMRHLYSRVKTDVAESLGITAESMAVSSVESAEAAVPASAAAPVSSLPAAESVRTAESAAAAEKESASENDSEKNSLIVCIDPGHQSEAMTDSEPIGPGASDTKMKVTGGATGVSTGNTEYQINLEIGLKLREELEARGYTVVMTRTENDVELSNVDRAEIATDANADIFIRLHCDGASSADASGVHCLGPAEDNPYLDADVIEKSNLLCDYLRDEQVAVTEQDSRNNTQTNTMTGINWATMPVAIVEMGFLSNAEEDQFLATEEGQNQITQGLANGVDAYFADILGVEEESSETDSESDETEDVE
ncbi:MAG: N-acetylmuramoyl-L-alanine amidase [Lachnospiraceae bacterium]|nr:N-acetylmuramoyl-L-alanine amidase [Lachnospiraceae bacterium]